MIRILVATAAAVVVLLTGGTAVAGLAVAGQPSGSTWARPVPGAVISQGFGCTDVAIEPVDLACPGGHWHTGVDLAAAQGTAVHATLSGIATVITARTGYGLHVIIEHGDGLSSLYGHLSAVEVISGSYVVSGEVIGAIGSTGNSTGPHLHFEVRRDGITEDPRQDVSLP